MRSLGRIVPRRLLAGLAMAAAGVTTACGPVSPNATTGNAADYSLNVFSGWVQRWNPCAPVHYRVNPNSSPAALNTTLSAVNQLSRATGITFVYDGLTSFVPSNGAWKQPAPLVIAFSRPGLTTYLSGGNQLGEGGFQSSYTSWNGTITSYKIVNGYAVIDANGYNRSSDHVKMSVLLHELGHAVGLNHARLSSEVMYPTVSNGGPAGYSAGDLAGLAKVGRSAGCLS